MKEEAEPIARLLGPDRAKTVGWVYLWNTSELSVLWLDRSLPAQHVDPPLPQCVLTRARAVTTDAITDLLDDLSMSGDEE
ncbi:hypothetical protein PXK05_21100 [Phaeobacter gallaeciensis]|uniref:hypothetical protein n=1 Tax=Phaeobacter gallaeciensis TaxID=60890 RepID=UPI00237FA3F8|nr:hypothetical protein [Phaeobacter gallaeciensis]MDE4230941.1 hypothetical protein [Phaeobacter gallaeciensis]